MTSFLTNYIRGYRHKKIIKISNLPENGSVLDVSCGDGKFLDRLHILLPELKLFGVDISKEVIEGIKLKFSFITASNQSVESLDFQDNTFDIIFSTMSLHHYAHPEKSFTEMFRVLKTDGVLYLTDLIPHNQITAKVDNMISCSEPYHFEKYYRVSELEKILDIVNFHVVENQRITFFPRIRLLKIKKNF